MKKAIVTLGAFLLLLTFASTSFADLDDFTWTKKLKRGFSNVLTAPMEIPKQTIAGAYKKPEVIMAFSGLFKGIAYTIGRAGSGFWDIITCNTDVPAEPLMKPACVFEDWPGSKPKE